VALGSGGDMVEWRQATVLETTRWGFEIGASKVKRAGAQLFSFSFLCFLLPRQNKNKNKNKN
jgi:hypothetical protein